MTASLSPVAVIGTGIMGRGIVQVLAQSGTQVLMHDTSAEAMDKAEAFIGGLLDRAVEKGRMTADAAGAAKANIVKVDSLAGLKDARIAIEAVVEREDVKRALFADLAAHVADDCILATNTSSFSVTGIAAGVPAPERVAGLHFFNPVPLMRVVEVIHGLRTAPSVVDALVALVKSVGHTPVVAKDSPGFLVNHAGRGFYTEALRILQEGVADTVDVDRVMREAAGFRMGPFELLDLTGLDVSYPVMQSIYTQFWQEPRFRPSPLPALRVAAGLLGRKTGEGFYTYDGQAIQRPAEPAAPTLDTPPPVWIDRRHPDRADALAAVLADVGATVETGPQPSGDALILLTPLGEDCTSAALAAGVDPTRAVAVDTLYDLAGRRTVMTNPATRPDMAATAHALLARNGSGATRIQDSPGLIAQRMVATIVNIACDIAQQKIASPTDIDLAVTLGLGYPEGPLALGDRLGPATILEILEGLRRVTGDMRYRPSPWLARRARLGLSLKHAEA